LVKALAAVLPALSSWLRALARVSAAVWWLAFPEFHNLIAVAASCCAQLSVAA
jgi:hypothetical protein